MEHLRSPSEQGPLRHVDISITQEPTAHIRFHPQENAMNTWLYQLSHQEFPVETFRYDIREGERWKWYLLKCSKLSIKDFMLCNQPDDEKVYDEICQRFINALKKKGVLTIGEDETLMSSESEIVLNVWNLKTIRGGKDSLCPKKDDTIVFYYPQDGLTTNHKPGFYGMAEVERWDSDEYALYFRSVEPTELLKRQPWCGQAAEDIAKQIRKPFQGTLFPVKDGIVDQLLQGIIDWVNQTSKCM
jgi:hypothetical protein